MHNKYFFFVLIIVLSMCYEFHKNEVHTKSSLFIPEIKKTIEFNSSLQINKIIAKSGFEPTMVLARYIIIDSANNEIVTLWFSKNKLLDSISYRKYMMSKFEHQRLLQEAIYNHEKEHSFPFYIYSYSYINTNKGNILITLREANPIGLSPVKINDTLVSDKDRLEFDVGLFIDSFQLSINLYKTTKDSSIKKAEKLFEPILNSIKIY